MPGTDRRNSLASEDANVPPPVVRQLSQDGTEIIPTRMSKVTAPKPASNPLQFIKVGPCDLYKAAQEQIKKVEEIKKVEKVKDESEDWQSNLDSWKCSRRKRQEHIIERVVEVKKLELEEHDRNRRRSKTFNEMLEERNSKGGLRKMTILTYPEDDSNDLSDLGISSDKEKTSGGDPQNGGGYQSVTGNGNHCLNNSNGHNRGSQDDESSTSATISSPEPEEYTYERAIQGYMNFAEGKVKAPMKSGSAKGLNGEVRARKETGSKVGEKMFELEQIRLRSKSANDLNEKQMPRVDISKRRSMFENAEQFDRSGPKDSPNQTSVKEKLSSLERSNDSVVKVNRPIEEVSTSIKDRVSSLERQTSVESKRIPNGDATPQISIKDRLNSLEKLSEPKPTSEDSKVTPERDASFKEKLDNFKAAEQECGFQQEKEGKTGSVSSTEAEEPEEASGDGNPVTAEPEDGTNKVKELIPGEASEINKIEISLPDRESPSVSISLSVEDEEDDEESQDQFPDLIRPLENPTKPKKRVRKLTPIMTGPKVSISPLKTVCELQIIEEGVPTAIEEKHSENPEDLITVHMSPGGSDQHKRRLGEVQAPNPETSCDCQDDQDEVTTEYTDENIDEVLGKEDDESETGIDEEDATPKVESVNYEKPEIVELQLKKPETFLEKQQTTTPNYENIIIANQMIDGIQQYSPLGFPLISPSPIEPPKEKPPPPPLDISDDESTAPELPPKPSLRRLDSTKRIKKEIRKKRSDFLGIDGCNDDSYLEPEMYVTPPPDMMTFLQEERRLEQQLYRQSICSESDSNHETAESRDSGVELDRGHVDDIWSKPDILSEPHSRQNSETFGNTSITSEEDEILKKEREIIEVLEKEEQWRYGNKNLPKNDIGEKLAVKLRRLEQEKMQLQWERAEEEDRRQAEESARREDEERLKAKEQQLREQENRRSNPNLESATQQEALRSERERLQKEQEHLERCRQNLLKQSEGRQREGGNRHSLHEVPMPMQDVPRHSMQDVSQPVYRSPMASCYRYSMPDLQQTRVSRPPPPIPPAKPQRPMTQEQWERETNIRNSRIPSADNIPQQVEAQLRHGSSVPHINHGGQQMTRSTLQALSAAPRSRIITNENWMQAKRKSDQNKSNYNYQHWLIQEAEHRRILEQKQRSQPQAPRRQEYSKNYATPPSHHTVGLPLTPQKWMSPLRSEKPLPDSVIQTLTQRMQNRESKTSPRRRLEPPVNQDGYQNDSGGMQERMLSVSGKKKCSHCNEELGRGAAMIIESLRLFYHIDCFKCCVCHVQLGDGLMGTDVRVRNNKLHCHNCYSSDDGVKFSCV